MQTYSLREVRSMLGLSQAVLRALVAAGFVTPSRGARREYRFSFQDMVLLRTAHQLQAAQIPPRRILHSLRRLRATLPESMPLTGLRISAVGDEVAVREGGTLWRSDSGQLLMDFDLLAPPAPAAVRPIAKKKSTSPPPPLAAADWFLRGSELESSDAAEAERAYRRAIELDPDLGDAWLNLGVLLGEAGRTAEAIALYRQAIRRLPDLALLHFNLAVMLEDAGRAADALAAYDRCLALDPKAADAHYNAARLHEQLGHAREAIRHWNAYRRLKK
jgi:tetratricopeptide (TPR) repeat protein